ncbi:uncharacterized protein K460DRAFT_400886 [Cucurbitaria berberidis CBS 394.84]|uniref:Heterokaryon incompatibility domain-containing protein n=1 Tax=Cucurbitaria berberidis CBS 394.84 TaxID=1168544 RepID=A0A9P4GSB5_9PLEO|nr:uncharacterized protein K460DRAFT_400886 [Cucurbitaria berberidis CBS 394.84]KAF1850845.1 hypothetical protein K460DRAFT_400886 [Cucurbitaria berberidis CBS 394.84]
MRLLHCTGDGKFSLVEYIGDEVPRYAILSHVWRANNAEEVTFKDLMEGRGEEKPGYRKIQFCGEQATQDDIEYFWVDTCCTIQSHHRYLCPTKVAAYAAEDGGRMYIAIQYKCSNFALLSHLFIKESLFHTLIPDPNLVQRA